MTTKALERLALDAEYRDGFTNGYGAALCQLRTRLEHGMPALRALLALREHWLTALWQWADEGDSEFPPSVGDVADS